jgi:hypothetical protein
MPGNPGCGHLTDDELLAAVETLQLNTGDFHHVDHLRVAWLYIRRYGPSAAERRLLDAIRNLANHAGAPQKFLFTTTVAWARLVAASMVASDTSVTFEEWIASQPHLLVASLLDRYYSKGVLTNAPARAQWVEPDLMPLPSPPGS